MVPVGKEKTVYSLDLNELVKRVEKKRAQPFGTLCFKGDKTTLEVVFGSEPISAGQVLAKIWVHYKQREIELQMEHKLAVGDIVKALVDGEALKAEGKSNEPYWAVARIVGINSKGYQVHWKGDPKDDIWTLPRDKIIFLRKPLPQDEFEEFSKDELINIVLGLREKLSSRH
jgi:hypothetical protein